MSPSFKERDDAFYAQFSRRVSERGTRPAERYVSERRRAAIEALATRGATEGERAAARAALHRVDATHSETDRMQRGGNYHEDIPL